MAPKTKLTKRSFLHMICDLPPVYVAIGWLSLALVTTCLFNVGMMISRSSHSQHPSSHRNAPGCFETLPPSLQPLASELLSTHSHWEDENRRRIRKLADSAAITLSEDTTDELENTQRVLKEYASRQKEVVELENRFHEERLERLYDLVGKLNGLSGLHTVRLVGITTDNFKFVCEDETESPSLGANLLFLTTEQEKGGEDEEEIEIVTVS